MRRGSAETQAAASARLLDEAEDIVNAAGPAVLAEVEAERARAQRPFWRRLFGRG